jgi:hypothetical protein
MTLRPAFPDELGRAKALLDGHPVPPAATFLLLVKEQPVERIYAAIPWWTIPGSDRGSAHLRFFLAGAGSVVSEHLQPILGRLEAVAREQQTGALFTDFSLPAGHPRFQELTASGFEIAQTDRYFSIPGELAKQRCQGLYRRAAGRIPGSWKVESIRGHAPDQIFALVGARGLMSLQQFRSYWNTANREHFEEKFSCVTLENGQIIGAFLVTRRGESELHVHVDVVSPERKALSGLITLSMRHFTSSACGEGFPEVYTSRADAERHRQTGNTAIRNGGTELAPLHYLKKELVPVEEIRMKFTRSRRSLA